FLRFFELIFQHGIYISFSVQNTNDTKTVACDEIIDADRCEPCHRPGPQSSQFWVLYQFWSADAGPLAYLADCGLHSGQEPLGHGRAIFLKEEISVLTQDVIARRRSD